MALEGVALVIYRRKTGSGLGVAALFTNLFAGACLLLALRGALVQSGWGWIAGCLGLALIGHLADLRNRWGSR